jgi:gamma-glutamyltranspeptidase/glutathione hydrolase
MVDAAAEAGVRSPHVLLGPHGGAFRPSALGYGGVVTSAHGLATAAGIRTLLAGGNAVDAAVAVAAALGVVEPYMSGLGGGGGVMLITRPDGTTMALDYVGHAPRATDPTVFEDQEAVRLSPRSPCVPGMIAGWLAAHERFGRLEREQIFAPAIELAERGAPVTPMFATVTAHEEAKLRQSAPAVATFLPNGRPPRVGETVQQPALARSLRLVAERGAEVFYRGELGERLVGALAAQGGILTMDDLAELEVFWHEPVATIYRGTRLLGPRPPSTAFQTLETLRLLEGFDLVALAEQPADYLHTLFEVLKLARADRAEHALGPFATVEALLTDAYLAERRRLIDPRTALLTEGDRYLEAKPEGMLRAGRPERASEHTTHFCAADRDGMVVSVTHSLGAAYGCGVMAGDTGIVINNFGYWLDLSPDSPNHMAPGRRMEDPMGPVHVVRDGRLTYAVGTPGSFGIPQTIAQVLINLLDFGLNVQAAIEAPRVRLGALGRQVQIESRVPEAVREDLIARGHEVEVVGAWDILVGGMQAVAIDAATGLLMAGADPRRDGVAFGLS